MDLFSQRSGFSGGANSEGKQGARSNRGKGQSGDSGQRNQASIQQQLESINRSVNKSGQDDDHKVFKLNNQTASSDKNQFVSGEKGKNLDQYVIDNPPIKDHGGLLLTEFVIVGDQQTAFDGRFITQNQVTHVLNTCGGLMPNIFDPLDMNNPKTKAKLEETKQTNSPLIGRIKYYTIKDWEEHKVHRLLDVNYLNTLYYFIEEAVQNFKSCLIASVNNKCATIVVAIVYMMFKYKWNVHKTLEFICSRKTDIEITKTIIKQLQQLEQQIGQELRRKKTSLRTDWNLHSSFAQVFKEDQLSAKDIFRLAQDPSSKRRVQRDAALRGSNDGFYMGENLMLAEDEASIINLYLNSQKNKKDDKKKGGVQASQASAKGNSGFKSMKELIAETLKENDDRKEQLKKLIDWRALDVVVDKRQRQEKERKYLTTFKSQHNARKKPAVDPVRQQLAQAKRQHGFEGAAKGPKILDDLKNNEIFLNLQRALKERMTKQKKPQVAPPEVSAKKERPEPVSTKPSQDVRHRRLEADSPVRQSQQLKDRPEELLIVKKETMQARVSSQASNSGMQRLSANHKQTDNGALIKTEDMQKIAQLKKEAGPPVRLQTQKGPPRALDVEKKQHRQQSLKTASEERKREPEEPRRKSAFAQFAMRPQPIGGDIKKKPDPKKESGSQPHSPVTPIKAVPQLKEHQARSEQRLEDSRVFGSKVKQPSHAQTAHNIHEQDSPMIKSKAVQNQIQTPNERNQRPTQRADRAEEANTTSKKHRHSPTEAREQADHGQVQLKLKGPQASTPTSQSAILKIKPSQITKPQEQHRNQPQGGLPDQRSQPSAPRINLQSKVQTPQRDTRVQYRNPEDQLQAANFRNSHGPSELGFRAQRSIRHQTEKKVRKVNSSEYNLKEADSRLHKPQPQTEKKASLLERQMKETGRLHQRNLQGRNENGARPISDFNLPDSEIAKQAKSVQPSPGRPPLQPQARPQQQPQEKPRRILKNRRSSENHTTEMPSQISSPAQSSLQQSQKMAPQQPTQNHPSQQKLKTKDGRPFMNVRQQLQTTNSVPVDPPSIQAQKARYQQHNTPAGQKRGNMSHDEQTIYTNGFVNQEPPTMLARKQTRIKSQLDHQTHRVGRDGSKDTIAANLALPELRGQPPSTQRSASASIKRKDPKLEMMSQSMQIPKQGTGSQEEFPNLGAGGVGGGPQVSTIQPPKQVFIAKTPEKRGTNNGLTLPTIDMSTHQSTIPNSVVNNKRKIGPLETPQSALEPKISQSVSHKMAPPGGSTKSQNLPSKPISIAINQSFKLPKPPQNDKDPYNVQNIQIMQKQNSEKPTFGRQTTRSMSAVPQGPSRRQGRAPNEGEKQGNLGQTQQKPFQAPQIDFIGMDLQKQPKSQAHSPVNQPIQKKPSPPKAVPVSNEKQHSIQQKQPPVAAEAPRKIRQQVPQPEMRASESPDAVRQPREAKPEPQPRAEHTPSRGLDPRKMQQIQQSKNYALQQQQLQKKGQGHILNPQTFMPKPKKPQMSAPASPSTQQQPPQRQKSGTSRKPEASKPSAGEAKNEEMQAALDKIMMKLENQQKAREQEAVRNPPKKSNKKTISRAQVISHNKPNDGWIIINKKVYDVSHLSSSHPGGVQEITRCLGTGRDHAGDFEEGDHSKRSQNRLKQMYIGDLE